jgi:DNA-binding NtrC family response regulator
VIRADDLFPDRTPTPTTEPDAEQASLAQARDAAERAHIERVLAACDMRYQEAARQLGISRTTLWEKIKRYGIDRVDDGSA